MGRTGLGPPELCRGWRGVAAAPDSRSLREGSLFRSFLGPGRVPTRWSSVKPAEPRLPVGEDRWGETQTITAGQGREVGDARRGKAGPWCARPGQDGPRRLRVDGRASAAFSVQPAAGSWRMATANEPLSARFQRFVSYRTLSSVQHPACHCPPKDADTVADVEPPWDSNPVQSPLDQVDVAF